MTLVYEREVEPGPRLHALVIGCGRFPWLSPALNADRQACFDSGVEMIRFLARHADQLEPKLATLDCLLADPRVDPDQARDSLPADPELPALRAGPVERPLAANVVAAFDALLLRCRPGDSVFFYSTSHGVAGRDETGLLVLEDVGSRAGDPWAQLLDVKSVAMYLPARAQAGNVWIFMDACQEVLEELKDQAGGVDAIQPVKVSATARARYPVSSTALAAARYGTQTHAPAAGGIAYFTQALLNGLGRSCVEKKGGQWRVTAKQIVFGLEDVARAAGVPPIETTSLIVSAQAGYLLTLPEPSIPVHISSVPMQLLAGAASACLVGADAAPLFPKAAGTEWRFWVPAKPDSYEIRVDGALIETLEIDPPAVKRELSW
ncbi:MAG: hypothetical protein ACXW27_06825 [Allosphingosinicella sp.]